MNNIQVKVLNPEICNEAAKLAVCAARLTQHGHEIRSIDDFINLYEKPYSDQFISRLACLPHPTLQKLALINVVVVGASRRFLAQITRHQNEVKFISASLQYSDYSNASSFVVPYEMLDKQERDEYLKNCEFCMSEYSKAIESGLDHDAAAYIMPQGLRNVLLISATPFQWKHMIAQRTCRRNTDETRYVMLQIWKQLYDILPSMFTNAGPFCMSGACKEGNMSCKKPIKDIMTPEDILKLDFPIIFEEV